MRIAPLGVWAHAQTADIIAAHAAADARLSHPNQTCQDSAAAYSIAIAHLVKCPGDAEGAISAAESWAQTHACGEVKGWLLEESRLGPAQLWPLCDKSMGFVRWAFVLAFSHLRARTPFSEALALTLMRRGDTDTNAAIVGGLLGALHGAKSIPEHQRAAVLKFKFDEGVGCGHERPGWLSPANTVALVGDLLGSGCAGR